MIIGLLMLAIVLARNRQNCGDISASTGIPCIWGEVLPEAPSDRAPTPASLPQIGWPPPSLRQGSGCGRDQPDFLWSSIAQPSQLNFSSAAKMSTMGLIGEDCGSSPPRVSNSPQDLTRDYSSRQRCQEHDEPIEGQDGNER